MWADEESVSFSEQGYTNAQEITSYSGSNFGVTFDKGTNSNAPKYYTSGTAIRAYGGNHFTVSSENTITKIVISFGSSDGSNAITTDSETYSDATWTGSATSVKFTIGGTSGNRRIAGITVTYTKSGSSTPTVNAPSFNNGTGTYTTAQSVELSCETEGASIYYTMTIDGTTPDDPTEESALYSSAISVTKNGTKIKAKAFKAEMTASSVASATYTIKPNAPTVNGGANVTITGDEGLTFYYTTDGSAPTSASTEYTGAFTPGDCTVKAIAYDTYGNNSDVASLKYKYMPLSPKNINSNYYEKVTDVSSLENGDAILIVNEEAEKSLGSQASSNWTATTVSVGDNVISNGGNAQKLVLVKKTESISDVDKDVFYFYTGSGYLYASSSSSNQLKTEAAPDDNNNARATISITNGDATVAFTGTYTRNHMRFNPNNGSPIFSCYASNSTQSLVQIYKEVQAKVTITSAGWAAYNTPGDIDFTETGVTAYKVASVSGGYASLETVTAAPKGTPLILQATAGTYSLKTATTPAAVTGNLLTVSDATTGNGSTFYALGLVDDVPGFYLVADGVEIPTNYITVAAGARQFIPFSNEATGIKAIDNAQSTTGNVAYNLMGQKIVNGKSVNGKSIKGIVIVNGKKYFNK